MQFGHFLMRRYKENWKKSDLTFRLQSDREKINVNVSGLHGIDHLDNHCSFQAVTSKKKPLFSDWSNCRWIHLESFFSDVCVRETLKCLFIRCKLLPGDYA